MQCHMKGCRHFGKENQCVHALVPPTLLETPPTPVDKSTWLVNRRIDLDNPPEEAKPYVALYELRHNDAVMLTREVKELREKLRTSDEVRLAAVAAALEWEHKYNELLAKLDEIRKLYGGQHE